jgi:hydroxypyruvate isomerase
MNTIKKIITFMTISLLWINLSSADIQNLINIAHHNFNYAANNTNVTKKDIQILSDYISDNIELPGNAFKEQPASLSAGGLQLYKTIEHDFQGLQYHQQETEGTLYQDALNYLKWTHEQLNNKL